MAKESVKGILDARKAYDKALAKEQKTKEAYDKAVEETKKVKEAYKDCLEEARIGVDL